MIFFGGGFLCIIFVLSKMNIFSFSHWMFPSTCWRYAIRGCWWFRPCPSTPSCTGSSSSTSATPGWSDHGHQHRWLQWILLHSCAKLQCSDADIWICSERWLLTFCSGRVLEPASREVPIVEMCKTLCHMKGHKDLWPVSKQYYILFLTYIGYFIKPSTFRVPCCT